MSADLAAMALLSEAGMEEVRVVLVRKCEEVLWREREVEELHVELLGMKKILEEAIAREGAVEIKDTSKGYEEKEEMEKGEEKWFTTEEMKEAENEKANEEKGGEVELTAEEIEEAETAKAKKVQLLKDRMMADIGWDHPGGKGMWPENNNNFDNYRPPKVHDRDSRRRGARGQAAKARMEVLKTWQVPGNLKGKW